MYDDHYTPGETEPWGLIRADGTRRPAYDAYRTTIAWFSGTVRAQRSVSDHAVLVTLEQADRTVYVMWARDTEDVQFHVYAETGEEIAARVAVSGALSDVQAAWMPGLDDPWFVVRAPAARPDPDQGVLVEGRPVILVIDGPPRPVWVRVGRAEWRLR